MKELKIKDAYAVDLPVGLEGFDFDLDGGYESETPHHVNFVLYLDIGEVDRDWSEHFQVLVVTPNNRPRNAPSARFILLPAYSFQALKHELLKAVKACEKNSWDECLDALRGRFRWEYD